jgi:hypothetical protein
MGPTGMTARTGKPRQDSRVKQIEKFSQDRIVRTSFSDPDPELVESAFDLGPGSGNRILIRNPDPGPGSRCSTYWYGEPKFDIIVNILTHKKVYYVMQIFYLTISKFKSSIQNQLDFVGI